MPIIILMRDSLIVSGYRKLIPPSHQWQAWDDKIQHPTSLHLGYGITRHACIRAGDVDIVITVQPNAKHGFLHTLGGFIRYPNRQRLAGYKDLVDLAIGIQE
jgi:hypothetical protein